MTQPAETWEPRTPSVSEAEIAIFVECIRLGLEIIRVQTDAGLRAGMARSLYHLSKDLRGAVLRNASAFENWIDLGQELDDIADEIRVIS